VSALAHLLEQRGLPTTVIGLVLPHLEKTKPPRALMVPFMLGRPLGEPNDSGFQKRVLLQALKLLTKAEGPAVLEHFPDDNPSAADRLDWQPSVILPKPALPSDAKAWEQALRAELVLIAPAWERFKRRFARTTVGLAGQGIEAWPGFIASALDGALPKVPLHETSALALRFLVDDIKAIYGEAVQAEGDPPSARQIDTWFWRDTLAGQLLLALRSKAMQSENNGLKTVGTRFFVPAPYVPSSS
jgi:hypothetical protein